jgi:hypothetical protein
MATTPTIDLPRSKVRVIKPDKETGEIIERVIPAKDFRPKPPAFPKLDERLITLVHRKDSQGPTGKSVIAMFAHREAVIAYWAYYAHILTREERREMARGKSTSVLRDLPASWKVGDRMFVAANMEAEVTEITESVRGHGAVFRVHDHREVLLKRGVLGDVIPKTDKHGYAAAVTPQQKEKAGIESAYTTSASQAIDEAGAVMDEAAFRRIHIEQSADNALTQSKGRVQVTKGRLRRRIVEAKAKHRTSTERHLQRQLDRILEKERNAVTENASAVTV